MVKARPRSLWLLTRFKYDNNYYEAENGKVNFFLITTDFQQSRETLRPLRLCGYFFYNFGNRKGAKYAMK